jgi:predicted O-linked N-acetylglucosamine transferase (SPINDLY family)
MSIENGSAFAQALQLHTRGDLAGAEAAYRRIIAADPGHADSIHMLGVLAHQCGQHVLAADLINSAIGMKPSPAGYSNLAAVHLALGNRTEAETASRRALSLAPDYTEALCNLGLAVDGQGRHKEAAEYFRRAIALGKNSADVWKKLATSLHYAGDLDEAISCYRRALELDPNDAVVLYNIGHAFQCQDRHDEAEGYLRKAIELKPDYADALLNLGLVMKEREQWTEAESLFKRALAADPRHAAAHYNLSITYIKMGRPSAAGKAARDALAIKPDFAEGLFALGNAYYAMGRRALALEHYRRAFALKPNDPANHNNILACVKDDPEIGGEEIRSEIETWARIHAAGIPRSPHANDRSTTRRIRIAYLSPDFCNHSVAYYLEPLLESHDRDRFEVYGYSEVKKPDAVTARFEKIVDRWRVTHGLADEQAAALIQNDRIDVLIDCVGHTQGNRLFVLARKPAPVQVATLIGYEATTGLAAMDYVLGDPFLTPPGFEAHFTEALVRLPRVIAPFRPNPAWPEISPVPEGDLITLACFADPKRISEVSIECWRQILERLPAARVLLKHGTYKLADHRRYWSEYFSALGERVEIEPLTREWKHEMGVYARVTIGLDPIPLTGGTTTLIPLWMGVPVVSLAGRNTGQRYGASILANAGVPELVAASREDYVDRVVELARDRERLVRYRRSLRDIMRAAPIMDERGVTAEIEACYRQFWQTWCAQSPDAGP